MELQAVTGQLYIIDGLVQEGSDIPGLLAQSAPSKVARGRENDYIFVHLSLSGQQDLTRTIADDLIDHLRRVFYNSSGSVTAALRKAILEANQLLLGFNLNSKQDLVQGAITCAVKRNEELYIAQSGEAFALIGHNFGLERLPPTRPQTVTPLGRSAGIDLRFHHTRIQSGDALLLADPRLAHLPTDALEPILIDGSVEEGLNNMTELIGEDSARLIFVEFTDEAPGFVPGAPRPKQPRVSGKILSPPTNQPIREGSQPPPLPPLTGSPKSPLATVDVEVLETSARKATSMAALGLSRGTAWTADMMSKVHSPTTETRSESANGSGWALPAFLAIAIPIIVAVIVVSVYIQRGEVARINEIRFQMEDNFSKAKAAADPTEAEQYYQAVLSLATEAEMLRPGDLAVIDIRTEALAELDNIAGVGRLVGMPLYQFDPSATLSSIELNAGLDNILYVLDSTNSLVYTVSLDQIEESPGLTADLILSAGQIVGSHAVGQLEDLLWRTSGNQVTREGLAILDLRGALLTYYPSFSDLRAVPLELSSEWVQPSAITTFNERLYVLDPGKPAIWRYFPDGEGFTIISDQQVVEFADDPDLDQATDLAIYSEDGSIILLYDDGRLRHYANGRLLWHESDLANNGLAAPLLSPTSVKIIGSGLNSSVYVADPGSNRIVQFSLGGTFLAQYKATDELGNELFGRINDFVVLNNPFQIYVVTDNGLYRASTQ